MSSPLESPPCPLCKSVRRKPAYSRLVPYEVVLCCDCEFHYLCPRLPEEEMIAQYRDDAYYHGDGMGYEDYDLQTDSLRVTFRRLLVRLDERGLTGGDLLEVGCGFGLLLDEARGFFSRRVGTDFSRLACERARPYADEVYEGGLEQVPPEDRFDCIVANHVIEHIYRPVPFVQSLVERLRPGGTLFLGSPDMSSPWRRVMGHGWPQFKVPEHVLFFDARSLRRLMEMAGLSEVTGIPCPCAFPLALVASKLKLRVPRAYHHTRIWLPWTSVVMLGRR